MLQLYLGIESATGCNFISKTFLNFLYTHRSVVELSILLHYFIYLVLAIKRLLICLNISQDKFLIFILQVNLGRINITIYCHPTQIHRNYSDHIYSQFLLQFLRILIFLLQRSYLFWLLLIPKLHSVGRCHEYYF